MGGQVANMFKTKSHCCGHSKKKNQNHLDIKMVKTETDAYTFEDLPCDVKHTLHDLGNRRENVNIELLLIKINNHIRKTDSFRKKDCDPKKFETDLKLFKEWFNKSDE